jgi:hypothetical protein
MIPLPRLLATAIAVCAFAAPLAAQTKFPPPPEKYDVEFRYRIKADRNERIRQFLEMTRFLRKLGFVESETEDSDLAMVDPSAERMSGTIPAAGASNLLREPRIQTVLLRPAGYKWPMDEKERVKVRLLLTGGFPGERQQLFANQVKQVLAGVGGFREAVGYDHQGYTVLRGTMPWAKVPMLLKDLRGQPSGWFLPLTHEDELPEPFKTLLPIRQVEVLSEEGAPAPVQGQAELPPVPADQPQLGKLTADVRRVILDAAEKDKPLRVEVMLTYAPDESDNVWREQIRVVNPTTTIEGRLGNVVTLTVATAEQAGQIARLNFVQSVRLPRTATLPAPAANKEEPKKDEKEKVRHDRLMQVRADEAFDPLKDLRLDRLHAHGRRGAGLRIAVIDTDFTGFEKYVGKGLPRTTHYADLTAERSTEIVPEPAATPAGGVGPGTWCALAVMRTAPDADLALVRVSADAPYQIITAYRHMLGDLRQPESFRARREEIEIETGNVRADRERANAQYRKAFDDFEDSDEAQARRRAARAGIAEVEKKEAAVSARANRLVKLEADIIRLKGATVILNTLGWNSGQPFDGTSDLSRFLDASMKVARPRVVLRDTSRQPRPALWFQPAGDTRGQAWVGQFQDADNNGIMEWGAERRTGRWTPELNFLAFRPEEGKDDFDLPANARVRISVQWREPHDPEVAETEYRQPIAPLNLRLLRQRDPGAEKLATDEMEVIARSEGYPERLHSERAFGCYEQSIDVTLPAAGRYALRVEGRQPLGIRPGGALGIREQEVLWELKPRVFVEVLDAPTRAKGRIVFDDYITENGGVSVPADARSVVAVGAVDPMKRLRPSCATGAGPSSEGFVKPDVVTFDQLPGLEDAPKGTAMAAAVATGTGASLLSAGATPANFLFYLKYPPGSLFAVPESWLRSK